MHTENRDTRYTSCNMQWQQDQVSPRGDTEGSCVRERISLLLFQPLHQPLHGRHHRQSLLHLPCSRLCVHHSFCILPATHLPAQLQGDFATAPNGVYLSNMCLRSYTNRQKCGTTPRSSHNAGFSPRTVLRMQYLGASSTSSYQKGWPHLKQ